jgi:hypothetical protein
MFFDVEIGAPEFASLLIPIKAATLDEAGLKEFWRSQDLSPEELRIESEVRGQVLWQSLVRTSAIAQKGALELDDISENHTLLRDLAALVPSEGNEIERLEVTYRSKDRTEIVILDKKAGDRLLKAQEDIENSVITIDGVVTEINGDSKTFRIKDIGEYLTTCSPTTEIFDRMDKNGLLQRGQKLAVTGRYCRRKRLGFMAVNEYPNPL